MINRWIEAWRSLIGVFGYAFGPMLAWCLLALFVVGSVDGLRRKDWVTSCLPLLTLLTAAVLSRYGKYAFGCNRHSIYLSPLLILPAAAGVSCLWRQGKGIFVAKIVICVFSSVLLWRLDTGRWIEKTSCTQPYSWELNMPLSDFNPLRPVLEKMAASPGLIITDLQTVCTLAPLMEKRRTGDNFYRELSFFTWNKRVIFVMDTFSTDLALQPSDPKRSLGNFLQSIQAISSDPWLAKDIRIVWAGWGYESIGPLQDLETKNPDAPIITELLQAGEIGVLRLDARQYLNLIRKNITIPSTSSNTAHRLSFRDPSAARA